jgi:hypothetical protein
MTPKQLRAKLAIAGQKRTDAVQAKEAASAELAILVPQALAAGLGPVEIAQLTGLSRQAVYDFKRSSTER